MRFAICNETFQGWTWDRICEFAAATGYAGIEIAPFTLAEDVRGLDAAQRERIRRAAEGNGLAIVGLHWLLVSPKGLSATSPDAETRRATAGYLVALAQLCSDLGGSVMVFGSPAQRRIEEGVSREDALRWFAETLHPALDYAANLGISICVEPLPAPEANFIMTLDEAATILRLLDHPAARTILDVKSASAERQDIPALIEAYGPLIRHVHANDANRRGPGFGETDFVPILRALRRIGYSGYISVEVFDYTPDPETIARASLVYLEDCLCRASHGDL